MWQVFWNESADNELAQIWLTAPDRQAVSNAAREIDELLRRDPLNAGESREGNYRILFVSPLVVQYEVIEPDRKIQVLQCVSER